MAGYTPTEQESIDRLAEYNSNNYNPATNEYGMGNGGHRTNFPLATDDTSVTANAIARVANEAVDELNEVLSLANYKGDYNGGTIYDTGDSVTSGGIYWISKQGSNTGNTPAGGSAFWEKIDLTSVSVDETGFELDWSIDDVLKFTATADFSITFANVPLSGVAFVEVKGGGDWTATYPAGVVFDGGVEPQLASGTDSTVLVFYTSTTGSVIGCGAVLAAVAL